MGELVTVNGTSNTDSVAVDTFGGKVHVEWDPQAAVTPMGQLPFFIEFLKVSGLFEKFIETCPLKYASPNAPGIRDVLGTMVMSFLAGHKRYAHISSIRFDGVNPGLLGMEKVVSEDAVRRALKSIDEEAGLGWLDSQLGLSTDAAISSGSWIMDIDTTVKCLYGKQEGAVVSYNPRKPGRPFHNYQTCFMGNTRLALSVEVNPGNKHTAKDIMPSVWDYYDNLSSEKKPFIVRGDIFLGNEGFISQAETRGVYYLTKLRQTANVKGLIERLFREADWEEAGHGYKGAEAQLLLKGWTKARRVVVLRRTIKDNIVIVNESQLRFEFIDASEMTDRYEYAVLVTNLPWEILSISQLYRDRADCENCYDELKNQWGWGGYTTQDLKRCRFVSRMVALVYNWWSIYVRLASGRHREAITSRPLLLNGVARQTKHSGQTTITITSSHAKSSSVRAALQALNAFLRHIRNNAEQLHVQDRMKLIIHKAYANILSFLPPFRLLPAPT
jgi:hypothetical protein